ncbi:MAG TPA: EscN/YscN/HrcN family type III secretion system ATPase, partial [Clostridiales bacterium]|nr:EscN/YscN/HrcN family type III secretion system ATPase [Clostridiales bacterium]
MQDILKDCFEKVRNLNTVEHSGRVMKVVGLTVESNGPTVNMGNICRIYPFAGDSYVEA